jgi:ABC-type glutathione transport system ATPase component
VLTALRITVHVSGVGNRHDAGSQDHTRSHQSEKYYPVKGGFFQRTQGHVKAVDDVSFSIREGETLGLVGESGCGKTTTARAILQLDPPTSGSVKLTGRELVGKSAQELRRLRTEMQIIFQNPYSSLNPRMTVGKALTESTAT